MLRPSFKKLFNEDNFSESMTVEDDVEPAIEEEAEPSLLKKDCQDGAFLSRPAESKMHNSGDPKWDSDRSVYEIQLTQLQEQLVETMLENQQLGSELEKFKKKGVDSLMKELEEERKKNKKLEEKLKKSKPKRPTRPPSLHKDSSSALIDKDVSDGHDGWEDLSIVADGTIYPDKVLLESGISSGVIPEQKTPIAGITTENQVKSETVQQSRLMKYKIRVWNEFHDRLSDFFEEETTETDVQVEDDTLAIKTLRENVSRFYDGVRPMQRFISGCEEMFNWKNPWFSLSSFVIYLYSIWIGCFIPLVLLIAVLKLSINYLTVKGIAQKFGYRESKKESEEDSKSEVTSWSEKYQIVIQIARKVQNTLGDLADSIEKFESLFMWQHAEASKKLYTGLVALFFASLVLSPRLFFLPIGFGLGCKLFIVSPIYKRFPKVKKRYDNIARLWDELPTREQANALKTDTENGTDRSQVNGAANTQDDTNTRSSPTRNGADAKGNLADDESEDASWETIVFCDRFQLPQSEHPLFGWQDGRRCTLLNKDNPLSNMKHGRLYLTKNFLCFERNQFHSKKNFALRLHDIIEVNKSKPFSILPGSGMSIEVMTKTNEKPFLFGAMMGRDEAYESILKAAKSLNLSWGRKS
eukprot:gene6066-6768_t